MKKLSILLFTLALTAYSCKNDKKESTETETATAVTANANNFVVKPEGTTVKWTAYKTTAKKGVGGEFTTLKFNEKSGTSPQDALNNLNFSIPISSVFTKNDSRDYKIKTSFFGKMLDTDVIKGTIKVVNGAYLATLTMNGVTKDLPLNAEINGRRVKLNATMDLKNWNALDALAALNKVCYDLHKGADGISKTWEDVSIEINTFLRKS